MLIYMMSRAYSEKISFITFFPLFTNIFTNAPGLLLLCAVLRQRRCCWAPAAVDRYDISCPRGVQQQTRRTLLQRSIDGTDRRADTRLLHRPCSAYYASSVNNNCSFYFRFHYFGFICTSNFIIVPETISNF